jgi:hypothetical protein
MYCFFFVLMKVYCVLNIIPHCSLLAYRNLTFVYYPGTLQLCYNLLVVLSFYSCCYWYFGIFFIIVSFVNKILFLFSEDILWMFFKTFKIFTSISSLLQWIEVINFRMLNQPCCLIQFGLPTQNAVS